MVRQTCKFCHYLITLTLNPFCCMEQSSEQFFSFLNPFGSFNETVLTVSAIVLTVLQYGNFVACLQNVVTHSKHLIH